MKPTVFTVRYVPIKQGTHVQLGSAGLPGISGEHKLMGYQAASIRKGERPHGWLLVLTNDRVSSPRPAVVGPQANGQNGHATDAHDETVRKARSERMKDLWRRARATEEVPA